MKAEYKRDLKDNYLILSAFEEKEEDDYSIYMVEKNKIPGLLPVHRSRMDGALLLNYEITGKQPLTSLYEQKQLGCADILSILSELGDVLETLQKYLLSPENLVFDPEYIFLEPDGKKLCLCYAPGVKNEASIQVLAEFILRRLDHKDAGAVAAGYRFYGKTLEENFSLQSSLKELLLEYQNRENGGIQGRYLESQGTYADEQNKNGLDFDYGGSGHGRNFSMPERWKTNSGNGEGDQGIGNVKKKRDLNWADESSSGGGRQKSGQQDEALKRLGMSNEGDARYGESSGYGNGMRRSDNFEYAASSEYRRSSSYEEPEVIHKTRRKDRNIQKEDFPEGQAGDPGKSGHGKRNTEKGKRENRSTKKNRSTKESKNERFADRIFQSVHPAVLLSALFLLAALEILFYLGYLQLTETGGAFFLVLSVELLINSFWRQSKEEKQKQKFERWVDEEEDDEEYQELIQEMYQRPEPAAQPEEIGETRCLTDLKSEPELRLIPVRSPEGGGPANGEFPDIIVRQGSVTVGKMRQQCEVVLMAPAISRMHARLEYRQGAYYLKDLNSRNGTFLNGERLMPQEARAIEHGDRVAFADIQYRVVKM